MGEDGHTASIFPNDMSLLTSDFSVGVGIHPLTGQKRITLTGKTINNAAKVVFLLTGDSKAEILKQIINNEPLAQSYPASHVHSQSGIVDFYIDNTAAKLL